MVLLRESDFEMCNKVNFSKQKEVEEIKNLRFRQTHRKEDSRTRQKEFRIAFNLHASLPTQFVLHKF